MSDECAYIRVGGRDHAIHYPAAGNTGQHVRSVLEGRVYQRLALLAFEPDVVIDIGANVGASAAWFRSIYPAAEIFCYEPDQLNFEYLKRNLSGLPRITAKRIALYDADVERTLYHGNNRCLQHSIFSNLETTPLGERIWLRDALAELRSVASESTVLKVDTEGCEHPILSRLVPLFDKLKVIYLEFHSERDRLRIEELLLPTHSLWNSSTLFVHRGDMCYVHHALWQDDPEIQRWAIG